jgi:hypothetical protein
VCSASYGNNGWLGLAQIWITGGTHIVQGVVKNNDYYFGSSTYQFNNTAEMQHVICQEIGHTFGLGHQDESGISLNTCMDYYHNTSASDTKSTNPNQHDYDELVTIYSHLDSTTTIGASAPGGAANSDNAAPIAVERSDRISSSTITETFADGSKRVTYITWALGTSRH